MTWTQLKQHSANLQADAISAVANLAPWLAPIPTAWLVYQRTLTHLHWPWPIALAAAITLECLGIAILATALQLRNYNRDKRKIDPRADILLPLALVLLYFLAAQLLTVFLDVIPKIQNGDHTTLTDWAPAIFPLLSVAGMALLAIRADHQRRTAAIATDRAARSAAQATARRSKSARNGAPTAASQPQPLPCPLCDRVFATQQALNAHQRTHSQEKQDRSAFTARTDKAS